MKKIIATLALLLLSLNSFSQNINYKLLQGKWQNVDDKTNFLIFTKNLRKETADGMDGWDVTKYSLSRKSSKEIYINEVIDNVNTSIWGIASLDKTKLTLVFLSRGNYLKYRRVKN
jgi:hypothetical protein